MLFLYFFAIPSMKSDQPQANDAQIGNLFISGPSATEHRAGGDFDESEKVTEATPPTASELDEMSFRVKMAPTRSSFLAKWKTTPGASGYYLDVATDPRFENYVNGYHGLAVGRITHRIVSGLKPEPNTTIAFVLMIPRCPPRRS